MFLAHHSEKAEGETGGHETPKHSHGNWDEDREESETHRKKGKIWPRR